MDVGVGVRALQGRKGATPVLREFFGVQAEYHWSTAGVRLQ